MKKFTGSTDEKLDCSNRVHFSQNAPQEKSHGSIKGFNKFSTDAVTQRVIQSQSLSTSFCFRLKVTNESHAETLVSSINCEL